MNAALAQRLAGEDFKRTKAQMANESWRMNNLYWVQDEHGQEVPFVQREPQKVYYEGRWFKDIIAKGRQIGFSTEIGIEMLDACVFRSNTAAGLIDYTLDDAKKKLAKMRFAYERLPSSVRAKVALTKGNEEELWFSNGSKIEVGTTHRGGTLQFLHVSEFGKIATDKPDAAREIKTGALQTLHAGSRAVIESTAHGTAGSFKEMVDEAMSIAQKQHGELSEAQWKLHFVPWWVKREYRMPSNLVVITQELRDYFAKLRSRGIQLDALQEAWYAQKHKDLGPDDCREEFPSTVDELFFASVAGAYFKKEMSHARTTGRIGHEVTFDPSRGVYTSLDIGVDGGMVLIFWQTDGVRHRVIDCLEDEDHTGSVQLYATWLHQKGMERGFKYIKHYVPHDMAQKDFSADAKTRYLMALELLPPGTNVEVVPRVEAKGDSIEIARRFIANTWFDEVHAKRVVECLDNYQKKWNKATQTWSSEPLKNGFDHCADAFQNYACGWAPDPLARPSSGRSRTRAEGTSPWGA